MRKLFLFSIICLLSLTIKAQISVSPKEDVKLSTGKFDADHLALLKKTTTVFILRKSEEAELEAYQKLLDSAWTLTPIKVITVAEWNTYMKDAKYSFFTIDGFSTQTTMSRGSSYTNSHVYLHLWMYDPKSKSKKDRDKLSFARVELSPSFKTLSDFESVEGLYKRGVFRNWEIGTIANYLKVVNSYLAKGETRWLFMNEVDAKEIKKLKSEVLYIPETILIDFNKFTGDESKKQDKVKLMADYKFKYEIISVDKLNEMILTSEKPFYYLTYVKSSTDKYVTVQNSQTGKIIYNEYEAMSYIFKHWNMYRISKAVEK
jgi:hypothetical protein